MISALNLAADPCTTELDALASLQTFTSCDRSLTTLFIATLMLLKWLAIAFFSLKSLSNCNVEDNIDNRNKNV